MTVDPASPPRTGRSRPLTVALFAAVTLWCVYYAVVRSFTAFAEYDDEGYMIVTIRHFLEGHALYDEIYSQYGPFYYLLTGSLFGATTAPVTSETIRIATVLVWIACALVAAYLVWRLTGSAVFAAGAQFFVCLELTAFEMEPGHPLSLCLLLILLVPALGAWLVPDRFAVACALVGVAVGCLLMVKANVGLLLAAAVALWLATQLGGRAGLAASAICSAAVLAAPAALMARELGDPRAANYALVATIGMIPTVALLWMRRGEGPAHWGHALLTAGGLAAAMGACFALLVGLGTSPAGFAHGVLLQHLGFASTWNLYPKVAPAATAVAALGLVAFGGWLLAIRRGLESDRRVALAVAVAQVAFALLVLKLCVLETTRPEFYWPVGWLWLAAAGGEARGGAADPPRFGLLLAVASLNVLHAYPVAGTHRVAVVAPMLVVAAICLYRGGRWLAARIPRPAVDVRFVQALLFIALLGVAEIETGRVVTPQPGIGGLVPLDLPGARRLLLSAEQVATFRWLTINLRAHSDTFITDPGLNSFYVWTEMPPPTSLNASAWPALFDAARQQRVVDALAGTPRLCAVRVKPLHDYWILNPLAAPLPLDAYIAGHCVRKARFQKYELLVRTEMHDVELTYVARLEGSDAPGRAVCALVLPAFGERSIRRIQLVDLAGPRVTADTESGGVLEVADAETRARLDVRGSGVDVRSPRRLAVTLEPGAVRRGEPMLVLLFDERGEMFAPVPVLH
jgi:hypothetical protein